MSAHEAEERGERAHVTRRTIRRLGGTAAGRDFGAAEAYSVVLAHVREQRVDGVGRVGASLLLLDERSSFEPAEQPVHPARGRG